MRLTVKVLPLKQGPESSLSYGLALSRGPPAAQFALPIDPDTTVDEIWRRIEARYTRNYLTEQQARVFKIKKLKDAYGSDLDIDDVARALFADEAPENRIIQVEQEYFGREISIPPTSNLRPQGVSRKRTAETFDDHVHKRARRNAGKQAHLEQLPPIPDSQFDSIFPASVIASIGEIPGTVSQDQIIADSNPQGVHVNGFSDAPATKSESREVSPAQLQAIPESTNSSSRGSPILGEETTLRPARTEEEDHSDEITTPGSNNHSDEESASSVSARKSRSHQPYTNSADDKSEQPDDRATRNLAEEISPPTNSVPSNNALSAVSTPQPFPSSTVKSSEKALPHRGNLLASKNVKRLLSFSPRPSTGKNKKNPTSKANDDAEVHNDEQTVQRGSIFSISSGRSSRSPSEDVTPRPNSSKSITRKAHNSDDKRESVARLERVEVSAPLSPVSPLGSTRRSTVDPSSKKHRGLSDSSALKSNAIERSTQSSALKRPSKKWTEDEDEILLSAYQNGRSLEEIAKDLLPARTVRGCDARLRRITHGMQTIIRNQSNRETGSTLDIHSEANEVGFNSAQAVNGDVRDSTAAASGLPALKSKDSGRRENELSDGKLSRPQRRHGTQSEASPKSDNSKYNPILIPDQEFSGSEEEGADDIGSSNNDEDIIADRNVANEMFANNVMDKTKTQTLPLFTFNSRSPSAKPLQANPTQHKYLGETEDNVPARKQSNSSQRIDFKKKLDKATTAKPKHASSERNSEGRSGREKGVRDDILPNLPRLSEKDQNKCESNVNHALEDKLQDQLRRGYNSTKSPSNAPSRELSPNTDYIASSPPEAMQSEKSKATISKQTQPKMTNTPISSWLAKGDTGSSKILRDKFNELKKTSSAQGKRMDFLQSQLPTYPKLSNARSSGLPLNSVPNISIKTKDNDSDTSRVDDHNSSSDDDDEEEDDNGVSEDDSSSSSSSDSSDSDSDTNAKTATEVWQEEATSQKQHKTEPSSSNRYSRLAKMSTQFNRTRI